MTTQFVRSIDDFQIAYEVHGAGPALLLVHGFSNDRNAAWQTYGWIEHLQSDYTVIAMDVRGCGESSATSNREDYGIRQHLADVVAVLDACNVGQCLYWGWSFGATIGLHLAAHTSRVRRAVIAGTYFGPLFQTERWRGVIDYYTRTAQAKREGRLAELDLKAEEKLFLEWRDLDVYAARCYGVASWPAIEPQEVQCPMLIYTGTEDGNVIAQLRQQQASIDAAGLKLHVFDGFNHVQLISELAIVSPLVRLFLDEK